MVEIIKDNQLVIKLTQRLDTTNAQESSAVIEAYLDDIQTDIILDVTELEYISSAGLQVVLKCAKQAKESKQDIYLKGAKATVKEIFQISGFFTFIKEIE